MGIWPERMWALFGTAQQLVWLQPKHHFLLSCFGISQVLALAIFGKVHVGNKPNSHLDLLQVLVGEVKVWVKQDFCAVSLYFPGFIRSSPHCVANFFYGSVMNRYWTVDRLAKCGFPPTLLPVLYVIKRMRTSSTSLCLAYLRGRFGSYCCRVSVQGG